MTLSDQPPAPTSTSPRFAIAIPMLNEADNVGQLLSECAAAAGPIGPYEICVTNDGSTDATAEGLAAFGKANPDAHLTVITHARPAGQSAAILSAVRAARAPIICTLDGDGQNPPSELPGLLAPLLAEDADPDLGLVAGQRVKRQDTFAKRYASKAANAIRGWMLKDGTRDTGCGLKAYRREAYLALPFFNHMHRYLPALFQRDGWTVAHVDVSHRARLAGQSKYTNLGRAIVGLTDLFGVAWLIRRKRGISRHEMTVTRSDDS
jgi:dolichol-phosphate mannosyltransferase